MINLIIHWTGILFIFGLFCSVFHWIVTEIADNTSENDRFRNKVLKCEDRLNKIEDKKGGA